MYKIIGADGREYGPVTLEQVKQWIAEGRANALTRVLPEGATEWRTLYELPELQGTFAQPGFGATPPGGAAPAPGAGPGTTPPPPQPMRPLTPGVTPMGARPDPLSQVSGPATGLIVVAILNFVTAAASLMMQIAGVNFMQGPPGMGDEAMMRMWSGSIALISNLVSIGIGVLILIGGLKMKKLENFGLAVTSAILAALPCTSPCCLVGIPIGIWALVVLFRPEVKESFR